MKRYETIVIGAGSGGLTVAIGLARLDKTVALIERSHMGGDCTNTGCVPSKSLIYAASKYTKDSQKAFNYVRSKIQYIRKEESPDIIEKQGVTSVIKGSASFIDNHTVQIISSTDQKKRVISARNIVIATGSQPNIMHISGLSKDKILTNDTIFELNNAPRRIVIVGVGAIGCELGYALSLLGSDVHMIARGDRILSRDDKASASLVHKSLSINNVSFHFNASQYFWENNSFRYEISNSKESISNVDYVLFAIGRNPNIDGLSLDTTDVSYDDNGIFVNNSFKTKVPHIYAIGDVIKDQQKFTHLANAQGRIVVSKIAFPLLPTRKITTVPHVTFTKPEIATAGISLDNVNNYTQSLIHKLIIDFSKTDRGITDSITQGSISVWAHRVTGKVLRVTIVSENAGEMIGYWILAIQRNLSLWRLFGIILPYPVLSIANQKIADLFFAENIRLLPKNIKTLILRFIRVYHRLLFGFVIWLLVIIGVRLYLDFNNITLIQSAELFESFLSNNSLGPIIYVLFYIARPLIAFPATIITLIAGRVYGLWWGFILALFAGSISSIIPYFAGRLLNDKEYTEEKAHGHVDGIAKYAQRLRYHPFQTVLLLRLLYMPYDALSFVSGHYKTPPAAFFTATLLGNIIGTFTFVSLGVSFEGDFSQGSFSINPWMIGLSVVLFTAGIGLSKVGKKLSLDQ